MGLDVNALLQLMVQKEISDIHFKADASPAIRIHGKLIQAVNLQRLSAEDVRSVAYTLMTQEQAKEFEAQNELDFAYSLTGVSRFRVNVFRQRGTMAVTLRVVPLRVRSFEQLNLPVESLARLSQESRGLILFTGITGAGKTTTMNSFLGRLNQTCQYRVITIEDPIEYFHQDVKCSIVQREVGFDTKSFATALRHVLRQDPDVIVVGEMRDFEAIQAAITAAETGHLVLSTLHTMDAVQTIDRIVDAHPAHQHSQVRQQLANVLKGVVAQRLIPSVDGRGRFPATEVLIVNSLSRRHILEGRTQELHKLIEAGSYYGMHTFDQDLMRLYQEQKIDQHAAMENASNPEDVTLKMRGVSASA